MELKNRADMDPRYMWDLTPIFESDEAWEAALKEASGTIQALEAIPGTLGNSAEALKAGLDEVCAAMEKMDRLYCYAYLRKSGDNGDPRSQEMEARCISLLTAFQSAIAFLNPEILAID